MNNCKGKTTNSYITLLAFSGMFFSCSVLALPEDQNQQIDIEASSSEINLDQGQYIYRGTETNPAHITQGSMEIFGTEIRIEYSDGVLKRVTASGTPARFQQQPAVDQEMIHASGHTLDYDNAKRMLNIDGEAEFNQAGNVLSGHHIDYNLDTRNANASSIDGQPVRMEIRGATGDQP
jgi:lipopolysaccharide export system protein LptA